MADVDETERREVGEPTELKFVGPATAEALDDADFSAQDVVDKDVSYRMLLEVGVNPGVAAKIRRYHSLAWSFDNDGDLDRRSEQVRGLKEAEAAWVASSGPSEEDAEEPSEETAAVDETAGTDETDGEAAWVADSAKPADDRESTETPEVVDDEETAWVAEATSGAGDSATADGSGDPMAAEAAWRERSKPTPLTDITGIGDSYAQRLAEAGVTSVRSLATASPELLADVTGISQERLQRWHQDASEQAD